MAVDAAQRELASLNAAALQAPPDAESAFNYLRGLSPSPEMGVVLMNGADRLASVGQLRGTPVVSGAGTSVVFSPFYVTLQVVTSKGGRSAIGTALVHADPPADRIAAGIDDRMPERNLVTAFRFGPAADTAAGDLLRGATGFPLMRVEAAPPSSESLRFATAAAVRGRGAILLAIAIAGFIVLGWSDRRALGPRLFTIGVAMAAAAIVPWNNFSNFARVFDPAYFYSPLAGPLTASSGAFAMFTALLALAVIAFVRARRARISRAVAGVLGFGLVAAGLLLSEVAASGIVLPRWGATVSLWLGWELPLFLFLFSFWLSAFWLLRIAFGRKPMVSLRAGAAIALICGVTATFIVWTKTTEQRLQLAMRDVSGLQRTDDEAAQLLARFGTQVSSYDEPGTRADLLRRYATSDIAAADLQASLSTWNAAGAPTSRIDLAPLAYDSSALSELTRQAIDSGSPIIHQTLGPTGRQVMIAVPHRAGGATSVVESFRGRG